MLGVIKLQRTRKTIEARISDIEAKKAQFGVKIESYKAKISELDSQIQELQDAQKQKELENLLDVIKASGKTPEEVIAALK
jgi:septal ring factor EnvC (AmiA/AmiB activator)